MNRDANRPLYARCDSCGRNAWKVAIRRSPQTLRWMRERNPRMHKNFFHPTVGYCPSCFAGTDQEEQDRMVESGSKVVLDMRGERARKATPIDPRLLPGYVPEPTFETTESATGRRVWVNCGHPAERDVNDHCLTCGGRL